jgi:hypothetical protein
VSGELCLEDCIIAQNSDNGRRRVGRSVKFSSSHTRADPLKVAATTGSYIPGILRVHGVHIGLNSGFPQNVRKRWYKVRTQSRLGGACGASEMADCIETKSDTLNGQSSTTNALMHVAAACSQIQKCCATAYPRCGSFPD